MKKLISKEIESDLLKLGLYQIVGTVLGFILIAWYFYNTPLHGELAPAIYLGIGLFFSFSIYCGRLCLIADKKALNYSLANQMLQIVGFSIMGFAFKYVSGVYITIGFEMEGSMKFNLGAGFSKIIFSTLKSKSKLEIDFNLVAFAIIYWIDKLMTKVKEEIEIREINSIGN